ncbi:hypothetical protein K3181_13280 [Qipengyuania sp. YG27]|uniref:CYTH domain-containing protein n=1 Tax=Qipengyuania mesophila TaxID=2867246 RepID=A0ABS7JXN6_9SPHN|nr:hypothetical protein [Qipengyuania mesophila]MBX7502414.1 hypothetical protein [Qipengyuania mesophila]
MNTEFTFRIAGSYKPSDIPMERLGEYLVALGELFGEKDSVHFARLTESSTVVHARIEPPAVPKVERRVRMVAAGEGTRSARKAYDRLDDMLRSDNATGSLVGGDGNVIRVDFQGRNRPAEMTYGPIKQMGALDGEVIRVEGRDSTVHVGIVDGTESYSLEAPEAMGRELAALFRIGLVRFHGEGTWLRHGDGRWELRRFKIDRIESKLDRAPVSEVVAALREIGPGRWAKSRDPIGELLAERKGGESEH